VSESWACSCLLGCCHVAGHYGRWEPQLHCQCTHGVRFIHQLARSHHHQRCSCCRIRTSTGERSHSKPAEGRSRIFGGRLASQTEMARLLLLLALSLCAASAVAGMASMKLRAPPSAAHHSLSARGSQLTGRVSVTRRILGPFPRGSPSPLRRSEPFLLSVTMHSHVAARCTELHRWCCAFALDRRALDQIYRPFPWTILSRSMCRVPTGLPAACHQIRSVGCSCIIREGHDCRVG
jgi:hypothetical protein